MIGLGLALGLGGRMLKRLRAQKEREDSSDNPQVNLIDRFRRAKDVPDQFDDTSFGDPMAFYDEFGDYQRKPDKVINAYNKICGDADDGPADYEHALDKASITGLRGADEFKEVKRRFDPKYAAKAETGGPEYQKAMPIKDVTGYSQYPDPNRPWYRPNQHGVQLRTPWPLSGHKDLSRILWPRGKRMTFSKTTSNLQMVPPGLKPRFWNYGDIVEAD